MFPRKLKARCTEIPELITGIVSLGNLQFLDFSVAAEWEIFECGKPLFRVKGLFDASDA